MGVYDRQVANVQKVLKKKGLSAVLWDGTTQYEISTVVSTFSWAEMKNSLIQFKDRKALVAAADIPDVVPNDRFKISFPGGLDEIPADVKCRVVTVEPLNPGGQPIMYTLQVRR